MEPKAKPQPHEVVAQLMSSRLRPSTQNTYERNWKAFIAWLSSNHPALVKEGDLASYKKLPIEIVITFLHSHQEAGNAFSTISVRLPLPPSTSPSAPPPRPLFFAHRSLPTNSLAFSNIVF